MSKLTFYLSGFKLILIPFYINLILGMWILQILSSMETHNFKMHLFEKFIEYITLETSFPTQYGIMHNYFNLYLIKFYSNKISSR